MLSNIISKDLGLAPDKVRNVVDLLENGATVPFIARYRKEATGSMDEVAVGNVKELHERLKALVQRKATIVATIEEQGRLTEELKRRIDGCFDAVELEDIYLPYKPKRRTRATVARERGLEPLADVIWLQQVADVAGRARAFVGKTGSRFTFPSTHSRNRHTAPTELIHHTAGLPVLAILEILSPLPDT